MTRRSTSSISSISSTSPHLIPSHHQTSKHSTSSSTTSTTNKSTMRRSTTEIPLPITYTPTTHRISKAKKGKRVHACEFPGCGKVFTRAEHRRRHELNHNPEALYRCSQPACKKSFHRPDLLARHMERHELESSMDSNPKWQQQTPPMIPEPSVSKYASVSPAPSYLPTTQQNTMSIGSIVAPGIHPDLANDCSYMWPAMDMSLQSRPSIYQHHVQDADDSFYSPPEACPSPSIASDGPTFSLPSYPGSSVSSTPALGLEPYPENILDSELTASPMPSHASLRAWTPPEANFAPLIQEDFVQPSYNQYPPSSWSQSYDEQSLPAFDHFQAMGPWKSWTLP